MSRQVAPGPGGHGPGTHPRHHPGRRRGRPDGRAHAGASLEEQVLNGRPWDLDRNRGALRLLMPQQGTGSTDEEGFATGNADELYRIRDQITAEDPELVVVLSADHVYRFDVMDAVRPHRRLGAECTVVTTVVPVDEAGDHATVETDGQATAGSPATGGTSGSRISTSPPTKTCLIDDQGVLGDLEWPIVSHQPQRQAAWVLDGGRVADGMLSPGVRVRGTVLRSVLGPGVVIAEGALVRDSVVFADTVIEAGAHVDWAVVDRGCVIGAGAEIGSPDTDPEAPDAIVLIGLESRVGRGVTLGAGTRLEPGSTA